MLALGLRLAEERDRLGLTQERFGELAGVSRNSQANYEKGARQPDAAYLELIASAGVDVLYVLTGARSLSEKDLQADLKRYGDAWETLEMALEAAGRELSPAKKRKAADALYQASKAEMSMDKDKLTELVLQLAA
ncbi:helix-turn-helix domain-containing protein [Achromobacter xylosoxidans]|uniref:helix-turn-helix domain-containing protein n=1 Tax=Alcaligenes xylosoxydans xylosoxydans TaxID=85698 RepID=UPI0015670093|nr:helix-turn-helix transcriptional regulator [Achromobacter xylosoxidans]QKI69074.1 helix-turn-helix transcriptional regulator [Achromobacter xylosoxidans]